MKIYQLGDTTLRVERQCVIVRFVGVFNREGAKAYAFTLKEAVSQFEGQPWAFIGDINRLQPSPMDAIEVIQSLVDWMNENNCQCIINVARNLSHLVSYQVNTAAHEATVLETKTMDRALEVAQEVLSVKFSK